MFKLIEAISLEPVRLPIKPGIKITPGHIVKIITYEDNLVVDICDGYDPLGIAGNRCIGGTSIDYKKIVRVYPQRMIADILKFDRKNNIQTGNSLYCDKRGVLTNVKPFENSIVLGKVITPADDGNRYMQILWI